MSSALAAAAAVPTVARRALRTRTATLVAAGAACLGLSACGSGFDPLTYDNRNLGNSSNVTVGEVDVRNATVASPDRGYVHEAGDSVAVTFALANHSGEADTLVGVATDAASSVELRENGRPVDEIDVPAGGVVGEDVEVELSELTRDLRSGEYVELTLTFETSGETTFLVPVATPVEPDEREYSENAHHDEE